MIMYENYTRQSLPSTKYRELLGSAICVFNSNNQFVIENILRIDNQKYNWYELTDKTAGALQGEIKDTITEMAGTEIANLFDQLTRKRNRIVHSFQITHNSEQTLGTKDKHNHQFYINEEYLLGFIQENEVLAYKLHELRGF